MLAVKGSPSMSVIKPNSSVQPAALRSASSYLYTDSNFVSKFGYWFMISSRTVSSSVTDLTYATVKLVETGASSETLVYRIPDTVT